MSSINLNLWIFQLDQALTTLLDIILSALRYTAKFQVTTSTTNLNLIFLRLLDQ